MSFNESEPDYSSITISDLFNKTGDTALTYAVKFIFARSRSSRNELISKILDITCNELEKNKHVKTRDKSTEDSLTIELTTNLKNLNIDAAHDKQIGGHCDIVVEAAGGYLWLAEAKIHSAYDWLEKGFLQLSTRYSTGAFGQDTGSVIIYCWNQNSMDVLEKWRATLIENHPDIKVDASIDKDLLTFFSVHAHKSTGRDFTVRHKVVSLHFEPLDA